MLCLRCTFAVGSLYIRFFLDVGSEHMMEAEGHYRENRVEPVTPDREKWATVHPF